MYRLHIVGYCMQANVSGAEAASERAGPGPAVRRHGGHGTGGRVPVQVPGQPVGGRR